MATWTCPTCRHKQDESSADPRAGAPIDIGSRHRAALRTHRCPNPDCRDTTLDVLVYRADDGRPNDANAPGTLVKTWPLIPSTRGRAWTRVVPAAVRDEYDEACRTETSSPKASAALARRCVQTILRDFFSAAGTPLAAEIERIARALGPDPAAVALRALSEIENVRLTAERDPATLVAASPSEAALMIDLLDLLIEETYVARQRRGEHLARLRKVTKSNAASDGESAPDGDGRRTRIRRYVDKILESVSFLKYRS